MRLDNRTCLITGAGRGIGRALALAFDAAGCDTFLVDLDYDTAGETARMCKREARVYKCDISDYAAVTNLVESLEFWGVDILVNNAGVGAVPTPFEKMTPEAWHKVMSVNLDGTAWMLSTVGRMMIRRGGDASIVNIASMSGLVANRGFQNAVYNASKAAIIQLTRSLACEWAPHRIRVNAIAPGPIQTPMSDRVKERNPDLWREFGESRTLVGRWGRPEEVASLAVEVAGNTYMTGACVVIDGGYTAW